MFIRFLYYGHAYKNKFWLSQKKTTIRVEISGNEQASDFSARNMSQIRSRSTNLIYYTDLISHIMVRQYGARGV